MWILLLDIGGWTSKKIGNFKRVRTSNRMFILFCLRHNQPAEGFNQKTEVELIQCYALIHQKWGFAPTWCFCNWPPTSHSRFRTLANNWLVCQQPMIGTLNAGFFSRTWRSSFLLFCLRSISPKKTYVVHSRFGYPSLLRRMVPWESLEFPVKFLGYEGVTFEARVSWWDATQLPRKWTLRC